MFYSQFAEGEKLTNLVKTYSGEFIFVFGCTGNWTDGVFYLYTEFISFPIEVFATKSVPKQVEDTEATAAATEEYNKKKIEAEVKGEEFTEDAPVSVLLWHPYGQLV